MEKSKIIGFSWDEDWLEKRRQGLTATDTAKIMGMSKYGSAVDVYLDKLGVLPPVEDNPKMYWGRALEKTIIDQIVTLRPWVEEARVSGAMVQSIEYPFLLATLDGLGVEGDERVIIEAKASAAPKIWEEGPPDEYILQVQKQLLVTGDRKAYICVLINGWDYRVYDFVRDEELIAMILKAETEFWNNHVLTQSMPAISPLDTEAAKHLYPKAIDDTVILPGDLAAICRTAMQARAFVKVAEQAKDWADNKLKMALKEYKTGVVGEYKLAWGNVSTSYFDTSAFKAEQPELYAAYTKQRSSRRFTIKEIENGENNRRLEEQATRAITAELGIDEGYVQLPEDTTSH